MEHKNCTRGAQFAYREMISLKVNYLSYNLSENSVAFYIYFKTNKNPPEIKVRVKNAMLSNFTLQN